MKKIIFVMMIAFMLLLVGSVSAFVSTSPNIYIDYNTTTAIVLYPLDDNVWNITLWVFDNNVTWNPINFTWTGSQYILYALFTQVGDFPFVINSTEVAGDIQGTFLVREPFNVTFKFYKDKASTIFSSNKYVNNMAYVTAELVGTKTLFQNNYDSNLEPFIARISDSRFKKPVFYCQYTNGVGILKLYETGEYAVRLIDGDIAFSSTYSVPNVTKDYGVNVYVGKFTLTNSTLYELLLTEKDLNPFFWLFNWVLIILIVGVIMISIFLFFMIPDKPSFVLIFFAMGIVGLLILRVIVYIWIG